MHFHWSEPDVVRLLRFGDCLIILVAGILAYYTRFSPLGEYHPQTEFYALVVGALISAEVFHLFGLYDQRAPLRSEMRLRAVAAAWVFVVLSVLALGFLTRTAEYVSRIWVGLWFTYGLLGLVAGRILLRRQVRRWQRSGKLTRNIAVAGASELGQRFIEHVRCASGGSVRIVGMFDDRATRIHPRAHDVPLLGTFDDLVRFARANPVDQVVIALPSQAEGRLLRLLSKLRDLPVDVSLCPAVFEQPALICRGVTLVGEVPLLDLLQKPFSRWGYFAKEVEDRLLAALLLVVAAPFMLVIGAAVRLDSPGPILFRQKRYGFNNATIEVFKFRTMRAERVDQGEQPVIQAQRNDPRVTRIGRWLRRTSLDELPQLFNVLRGEMSIVGPRPHAVAHNLQYADLIDAYLARHRVKPGITGWAQVNGLRGETDTLEKMEGRIRHDLYYIENWSVGFDLRILARTLLVGFVHPNAH